VQKTPSAEARTAAAGRADLFPPIEPFSHGMLGRDETHTLYWEQSGNPDVCRLSSYTVAQARDALQSTGVFSIPHTTGL